MARSRLWKLAATMAVAVSGCAHCDTCDEPPVPCTGPGCNAALNVAPAPFAAGPASAAAGGSFTTGTTAERPPAPAEGAPPAFAAPALPDVPADAPASPPPGPVAPEKP